MNRAPLHICMSSLPAFALLTSLAHAEPPATQPAAPLPGATAPLVDERALEHELLQRNADKSAHDDAEARDAQAEMKQTAVTATEEEREAASRVSREQNDTAERDARAKSAAGRRDSGTVLIVAGAMFTAAGIFLLDITLATDKSIHAGDYATANDIATADQLGRLGSTGGLICVGLGVLGVGVGIPLFFSGGARRDSEERLNLPSHAGSAATLTMSQAPLAGFRF
jgi:hypothetical protein